MKEFDLLPPTALSREVLDMSVDLRCSSKLGGGGGGGGGVLA